MAEILKLAEHPLFLLVLGFSLSQLVVVVVAIVRMNVAVRLSQKNEAHLTELVEKLDDRINRLEQLHFQPLHTGGIR